MKHKRMIMVLVMLVLLYGISTVVHYIITEKNGSAEEAFNIMLTDRIHDAIEAKLEGPVMVAKEMSGNVFVRELIDKESTMSQEEMTRSMRSYLAGVKGDTGCDTAYFISDKTKKYYTNKGLNKVINTEKDPHDIWYRIFVGNGLQYGLDVDIDEDGNDEWTVFVNVRMEDEHDRFLGVCGVGIRISEIQNLLRKYENDYGIRIKLVNPDGLVQVDTNTTNIETTYYANITMSDTEDYVYFGYSEGGFEITKYVKELDWFLVVQSEQELNGTGGFDPAFLVVGLILFVIASVFVVIILRKVDRYAGYDYADDTQTDEVTGLHNRNYYKAVYGEQKYFNTTRYKSVAIIDIDSFSNARKKMDGDVILQSVTECAKRVLGEDCEIFRWREDEFTVFMDWSIEFAYNICNEFCREVENDGYVTVSVGVTEVVLSDAIMKNYYRAAQGCFLVKEMGGNGVKRK